MVFLIRYISIYPLSETSSCDKEQRLEFQQGVSGSREMCVCDGRELLPLACTLAFVTLQTVNMHKKHVITLKERGKTGKA